MIIGAYLLNTDDIYVHKIIIPVHILIGISISVCYAGKIRKLCKIPLQLNSTFTQVIDLEIHKNRSNLITVHIQAQFSHAWSDSQLLLSRVSVLASYFVVALCTHRYQIS